jgi:hypothetical protein
MEGRRLDQLAEALREAGIRQAFTPDVSRLTVRLWREIAILTIEEAFELGRLTLSEVLRHIYD